MADELDRLDRVKKLTYVKGANWSGDHRYSYNATDQITLMDEMVNAVAEEPGRCIRFNMTT